MARAASCSRWSAVSTGAVGEEDDVVGPLPHELGVGERLGGAAQHAERLVADLVAVAVGAVQQVAAPALADAGDVGQLVAQAGGDQHAPGAQVRPPCEGDLERASRGGAGRRPQRDAGDGAGHQVAAVAGDLGAAGGQQLGGRQAVASQEAVHVGGRGVARLPGIDHGDLPPGPGQDQGGGQAGGAAADDHDVVLVHGHESPRCAPVEATPVADSGNCGSNGACDDAGGPRACSSGR